MYGICGQAYRDKLNELKQLEQEVVREAVVARECDLFLDEASALERTGRMSEAIHQVNYHDTTNQVQVQVHVQSTQDNRSGSCWWSAIWLIGRDGKVTHVSHVGPRYFFLSLSVFLQLT